MNRLLNFVKIQATGNDFVVCRSEDLLHDELEPALVRQICNRQYGIGSDGLIVVKGQPGSDLSMHYFNSDGTEGEMCGNGLRAAVLFSYVNGLVRSGEWSIFKARDGKHHIKYDSSDRIQVEIFITGKHEEIDNKELSVPENLDAWGFVNTGVPHLVLNVKDDIEKVDVFNIGRNYRYHNKFQKQGTNVNFVQVVGENKIKVRTYERGVEQETLSCGTGVSAAAVIYNSKFSEGNNRVSVDTKGGILEVVKDGDKIYLIGPARISFTGHYLLENFVD